MEQDYFVETSALLGLTFFSDRWFRDVRPLPDRGHPLHTSELVLHEYCNADNDASLPPEDPEDLASDWNADAGKYRVIEDDLKRPLPEFFRHVRRLGRDDLTLEEAINAFIDHFGIREEAEPQIRSRFREHFENRAVTAQYINEFVHDLIDRILKVAKENRETLSTEVELHESSYHTADQTRRRWKEFPDHRIHEPDLSILVDATTVGGSTGVDYFVTGDSDLLAIQQVATEYFGLSIISMEDEFAPPNRLS